MVLCACFADSNPNSFGMDLVTGGQNESSVKNYNSSKPSANSSALLNKSFINSKSFFPKNESDKLPIIVMKINAIKISIPGILNGR